jgi:enoyl-CoA hydratase/carnithine racemase
MWTLLSKRGFSKYLYSNITLKFNPEQQTASLTLSNDKKRNPLSLETIREIRSALKEVESKITSEKLKVNVK